MLINGAPLGLFKGKRGIHHGFPLSTYLFILVIEGPSLLIRQEKKPKRSYGLKVYKSVYITYLLFINDVIIFGGG